MKKSLLLLFSVFLTVVVLGQAPGLINYQGVARNVVGSAIPNQNIKLRLSVRNGSPTGTVLYQETRTLKTNYFGMFTVAIGGPGASNVQGTITGINWSTGGAKYLQVEMDPTGGNNLVDMGTGQLLSVPYAMFAGSALPGGAAGGVLSGNYPNPDIASGAITTLHLNDNAVTTAKLNDGAVTASKIAPGVIPVIPTALPPNGAASGDLSGSYPSPVIANNAVTNGKIADNAVTNNKIADGTITAAKLAPGTIPTGTTPGGAAGGDLGGTYPNPTVQTNAITNTKIADNAVTNNKIADGSVGTSKVTDGAITAIKIAPGVIPTIPGSLPPNGAASGDLSGSYPGPVIAANAVTNGKIADGSISTSKVTDGAITAIKIAPGVIPTIPGSLPPNGAASGDLSGSYPGPVIAANAVTNGKIADGAVNTTKIADAAVTTIKIADNTITNNKIVDGTITAAKLAPGTIPSGTIPGGSAGGDLGGTYPNPTVASNAITNAKIADGAVNTNKLSDAAVTTIKVADNTITNSKIVDGTITAAKLAAGVIPTLPTSLPPNGAASGDLGGTYPSPVVSKLRGVAVSNTAPVAGEVLKFDGTQWLPGTAGGFVIPYINTITSASNAISVTNAGAGGAVEGINSSTSANSFGLIGKITSTTAGASSAGVKGMHSGSGTDGYGVWGDHSNTGVGVYGSSQYGYGIQAYSKFSSAISANSESNGDAAVKVTAQGAADAMTVDNLGSGNGLLISALHNNALAALAFDAGTNALLAQHFGDGDAVAGVVNTDIGSGITGSNGMLGAGVKGVNTGTGIGMLAQANIGASTTGGTALMAELVDNVTGDIATFKAAGFNVARIDGTGKGYFNGGTQVGGADVAEYFSVENNRNSYEPGDVLIISETADRTVKKSSAPYSTLVAGVYATKPGLMLTEENATKNQLDQLVPMGVIGVIPTKVCLEGGAIKRGDLLVTSSTSGVAMKADLDKVRVGQVLGKALQDYNANTVGKINVLVSVK